MHPRRVESGRAWAAADGLAFRQWAMVGGLLLMIFGLVPKVLALSGSHQPGDVSPFEIQIPAGTQNFSVSVAGSETAWSHLVLRHGSPPTAETYDFLSRSDGKANAIHLEVPEAVSGTWHLHVITPPGSAPHDFNVLLTLNGADILSENRPASKPQTFLVEKNIDTAEWHYFRVEIPENTSGWRLVRVSESGVVPQMYLRRGSPPTLNSYDRVSGTGNVVSMVLGADELQSGDWYVGIHQPSFYSTYRLHSEVGAVTDLGWDPGTSPDGTVVYDVGQSVGGDHYFRVIAQAPTMGVWRTALQVDDGEADLYLRRGPFNTQTTPFNRTSTRPGSDGFLLHTGEFTAGEEWILMVRSSVGAQWRLLSGDVYVRNLGTLAADDQSGALVAIRPEGMAYFRTTIPADTLAWRLGLDQDLPLFVRQGAAPHPASSAYWDLKQVGAMLVVPPYLDSGAFGGSYIIGVEGDYGTLIALDSRKQAVTDIPFDQDVAIELEDSDFPYVTFRTQVPVQQIGWQINVLPTWGDPHVAVRRDRVPNEFRNDGFSEASGLVGDSVTLVPTSGAAGITDGTYYITVYGRGGFSAQLSQRPPVVTDVPFNFGVFNDETGRAGWRYYRVGITGGIVDQLGSLGWELRLAGAPAGTEIALRRNALPGRWNYRANESQGFSTSSHLDFWGLQGFLQQPGHQADIWYVGVYHPGSALGSFNLTGASLTGSPLTFDGGTTTGSVAANEWRYYRVEVPNESGVLGWELRLSELSGQTARMVVRRDALSASIGTSVGVGSPPFPGFGIEWPSGLQAAGQSDWTGLAWESDGSVAGDRLVLGMGNPLQPGTYYVGVRGANSGGGSYRITSRGIGMEGSGYSIAVQELGFGASTSVTALPAREAAYFRVPVPEGLESWKVWMEPSVGDAVMVVNRGHVPFGSIIPVGPYRWEWVLSSGQYQLQPTGGGVHNTPGRENLTLLPFYDRGETVPGGAYFVAVMSQGDAPANGRVGAGAVDFTLYNSGPVHVEDLGTVVGGTDLTAPGDLSEDDVAFYQFEVPEGTLSLEVRLEGVTGNPQMRLARTERRIGGSSYGSHGGMNAPWMDGVLITLPNPEPGTYSLTVVAARINANTTPQKGAYTLRVHAVAPAPLVFDGGTATGSVGANEWRYYRVEVPADEFLLGWDLSLSEVTGQIPTLLVRRGELPEGDNTTVGNGGAWSIAFSTDWPVGRQLRVGNDWTGLPFEADGSQTGTRLVAGMGNPLEPGTYYVGVKGSFWGAGTFRITSRAIGTEGSGRSIEVRDLAFGASATVTGLPAREAAYFRVPVPEGLESWKVWMEPSVGDAVMAVHRGFIPNEPTVLRSPYQWVAGTAQSMPAGGRLLNTPGRENLTLLPIYEQGHETIPEGFYYVAVMSQGASPESGRVGAGAVDFTLYNDGPVHVENLGTVVADTDLLAHGSLADEDIAFYRFEVPEGTLSLEVRLEGVTGTPRMSLARTERLVQGGNRISGSHGGMNAPWTDGVLITVPNPEPGIYSLTVAAGQLNGTPQPATYTVRVHAVAPVPLVLDGGTATGTVDANGWRFYRFEVPVDASLLGWELRLSEVTGQKPSLVVRRDELPVSVSSSLGLPGWATAWPSGGSVVGQSDWTGLPYEVGGSLAGPWLVMGMGNPLEPGTYYVGVSGSHSGGAGYRITSRGIGMEGSGYSIAVQDLGFGASATLTGLPAREAAYFRVPVPEGLESWKVWMEPAVGDAVMAVHRGFLPNGWATVEGQPYGWTSTLGGYQLFPTAGRVLNTPGGENLTLMPVYDRNETVLGGHYYVAVMSQGATPASGQVGSSPVDFTLHNAGPVPVEDLGIVVEGVDRVAHGSLKDEDVAFYRFEVPEGTPSFEVRLEGVTGNPLLRMARTERLIQGGNQTVGSHGGTSSTWGVPHTVGTLITVPGPEPGTYSLTIEAGRINSTPQPATYTVRVRPSPIQDINFSAALQPDEGTHQASGVLGENQRAYYRVLVPEGVTDGSILGWRLDLDALSGTPSLRMRRDQLPRDGDGASANFVIGTALVVPPWLTPGTWYVEVKGGGNSSYTLTSSALTLDTLQRPAWPMPALGAVPEAPGLSLPVFGDTGIDAAGNPLPGDRGVDLEQGRFHYYAVWVPQGNAGLLRTELQAISGNPNLYLRTGAAPTLTHQFNGPSGGTIYERSLTQSANTEYGNWVPVSGRTETELTPGLWVLAVHAAGGSNVRYRLILSCGNPTPGALVQEFTESQTIHPNQNLAGGDWRHYRFDLPLSGPARWRIQFNRTLGGAKLFIRDNVPAGDWFTSPGYDAYTPGSGLMRDWSTETKNQGPYPSAIQPGIHDFMVPPLRPGSTYYLGVWSPSDATFSLSVVPDTDGPQIPEPTTLAFMNDVLQETLEGYGSRLYRVEVPAQAARWKHIATHGSDVRITIEQGTIPASTGGAHWRSSGANASLNQPLTLWPWLPGHRYYVLVENTSADERSIDLLLQGQLATLPPLVDAGGPYQIDVGSLLQLAGSAFADPIPGNALQSIAWDLDDNGVFDDAVGPTPAVPFSTLLSLGLQPGTHTIRLRATDTSGSSATTSSTLTIHGSIAPPQVVRVRSETPRELIIEWAEPVDESTASDPDNYLVRDNGAAIYASLLTPRHVRLLLPPLSEGSPQTLDIQNVLSRWGIPINAQSVSFQCPVFVPGLVRWEAWDRSLESLGTLADFEQEYGILDAPDLSNLLTRFEQSGRQQDAYFGRLRAWFIPEVSDEYLLFCSSDDDSRLVLYREGTLPETRQIVARSPGGSSPSQWDSHPDQQSQPVWLEAGERYLIELLWRQVDGPDHASVALVRAGDPAPVNGQDALIHRAVGTLGVYVQPDEALPRFQLTLTIQPPDGGKITADPQPGDDGRYSAGTPVSLTAQSAPGYVFEKWEGAVSGTDPDAPWVMTDDTTVVARFYLLPVNSAPVAVAQAVATAEDTAVAIVLVGTDVDGDALTYAIGTGPQHGTLSGTAPNLSYTPHANYHGADSFTFTVNDGTVSSASATVTITVTPVNDAPVAVAQAVTTAEDTAEDTAVTIVLVGTDVDGDTLTYAIGTGPQHGTLSGSSSPLFLN